MTQSFMNPSGNFGDYVECQVQGCPYPAEYGETKCIQHLEDTTPAERLDEQAGEIRPQVTEPKP